MLSKGMTLHQISLISGKILLPLAVHTRAFSQTLALAKSSASTPLNARKNSSPAENTSQKLPRQKPRAKNLSLRQALDDNGSTYKPKIQPEPPVYPPRPRTRPPPTPAAYCAHRETLKRRFPEGWAPPRTISYQAMEALRALHAQDPVQFRTPVLANKFKISPEAVSRILKSKWRPSPERIAKLIARDNLARGRRIAEKMETERKETTKSLEGRLDITEKAQGKDELTMQRFKVISMDSNTL
jgi:hypothetical protein